MNSSLGWETDSWIPETLETAFLRFFFFNSIRRGEGGGHAPDPPR